MGRAGLLADKQQLEATTARLRDDISQLEAINARLLSDQEKITGHNELLIRMRDWYAERVDRLRKEQGTLDPDAVMIPNWS